MRLPDFRRLASAGLLLGVTTLHAQSNPQGIRPDPNDPAAVIPTAQYRSSFDRYKKMSDEAILPWKESNDLVGRIGGWRVYAREAESTDAPAPAPSTSPPPGPIGTERSRQPTAPGKAVIGTDHGSHK